MPLFLEAKPQSCPNQPGASESHGPEADPELEAPRFVLHPHRTPHHAAQPGHFTPALFTPPTHSFHPHVSAPSAPPVTPGQFSFSTSHSPNLHPLPPATSSRPSSSLLTLLVPLINLDSILSVVCSSNSSAVPFAIPPLFLVGPFVG
jgi:hypothetical protein